MPTPRQNATATSGAANAASIAPTNYGASGATVAGNLLIAWCASDNTVSAIAGGPSWTPGPQAVANAGVYMWYAVAAGGDAVPTITLTAADRAVGGVAEFATANKAKDVMTSAQINSTAGAAMPATTATASGAGLALAVSGGTRGAAGVATAPTGFTWGGGFTLVHSLASDTTMVTTSSYGSLGWADVAAAGSVAPTCTWTNNEGNRYGLLLVQHPQTPFRRAGKRTF